MALNQQTTSAAESFKLQIDPVMEDWQQNQSLGDCMLELYKRQLWTDVSFTLCDTNSVSAHKVVLAARSPVFQAMFYGPFGKCSNTVELQDANKQTMDLFLRYLYSDTVGEEDVSSYMSLIILAHRYQVSRAVNCFTEKIIKKGISVENACTLLDLALLYNNDKLRDAACREIDINAEAVLKDESFLKVSVDCLTYILKGDTLEAEEGFIFQRSIDWSIAASKRAGNETPDGQTLRKVLAEAFYYLRVPTFSLESFVECTWKKGYYGFDQYKQVVACISGQDVQCESHLGDSRICLLEEIVFDTREVIDIYSPSISCTYEIDPVRSTVLKGMFISSLKIRRGPYGFSCIENIQKCIQCEVSVPSISYKQTFNVGSGKIYFDSPVAVNQTMTVCVTLTVDWIVRFADGMLSGECSNRSQLRGRGGRFQGQNTVIKSEKPSGIRIDVLTSETEICGDCGKISLKTGNGFVKEFYMENVSYREDLPDLMYSNIHISKNQIEDENEQKEGH